MPPFAKPSDKLRWLIEQLGLLAAAMGQEVTPERLRVNAQDLADLPSEVLPEMFSLARKGLKFYPQVSELRALVEKKEIEADAVEAEKAWLILEGRRDRLGAHGKLDGATDYALRAIGGWKRFCNYELDAYSFIRRDFIAAYKRWKETGGLQAPSREEARKLLAKAQAMERKALAK